jgi:uracil-DNA glycosylase family 4
MSGGQPSVCVVDDGRRGATATGPLSRAEALERLRKVDNDIVNCFACPRLVAWRTEVASVKRAAFRDDEYWGRPVPGFGDPAAKVAVVGLAPAAHGANRTGRIFTGDRSGEWLFASMHRTGFANQAVSLSRDDGLRLTGAWVCSAVRCAPPANKPTPEERDRCFPFLVRELEALVDLRTVVVLGRFAYDVVSRLYGLSRRPAFGHGVEVSAGGGAAPSVVCSYHPSQQNTFTGKLTAPMLDSVFERAAQLAGLRAGR